MGIVDTYEKRHHVFDYQKKNIPDELVKDILYKAWKITPSKNNFMPYHVHVIGPEQQGIKDEVWRKCAFNHRRKEEDSFKRKDGDGVEYTTQLGNKTDYKFVINRSYNHVRYNSHLIMFSARVCKPNKYMTRMIEKEGHYAEQMEKKDVDEIRMTTSFECGLFAAHLAGICIEHGIDVSYNHCFPGEANAWPSLPFLWYDEDKKWARVFANMSMGYAKYYRYQWMIDGNRGEDLKPEMEDVVKWI
tara:strand:+ start:1394 stop:2128 length:735 start_codon:yes stop_codon:yes gene_type:complete